MTDIATTTSGRAAGSVPPQAASRAAYAAAAAALAFAAVSLYWALGGTAGLDTLGGQIEELARAGDPGLRMAVWVSVVLKVLGGMLALALVRPWGRTVPRWILLAAAWGGSALLVLYGTIQMISLALVEFGVITVVEPVDRDALRWRLMLWEPWFLVWGLLLGVAAWQCTRAPTGRSGRRRRRRAPDGAEGSGGSGAA